MKKNEMKTQIAKTANRIYYTMLGSRHYKQDVPGYARDWEKTLVKVTQGLFTIGRKDD